MPSLPAPVLAVACLLLQASGGPVVHETEHYTVRAPDARTAERVGELAEEAFALYEPRFRALGLPEDRLSIRVRARTEDIDGMVGRGDRGYWGVYQPGAHRLVVPADRSPRELRLVLLHEGFHQFLDAVAPEAPPWLHEGLAQYFQAHDTTGDDELRTGLIIASYVRMLADREVPELAELFDASMGQFHRADREQAMYAWAWLVAHALASSNERTRAGLGRVIEAYASDEEPAPEDVFGPGLRRRVTRHLETLAGRVASFDEAFEEARAAEEADDPADARRHYRRLDRLAEDVDDTRRWSALYRWALLEWGAGRPEVALLLLDRVIRAGVGWPAAHYQRARLRVATDRPEGAVADLEEVLRLRPDYGPAQRLLERIRSGEPGAAEEPDGDDGEDGE